MPPHERDGGHETFEHTADVGVRVWGRTLEELFEQAAAGLIETMIDPSSVRERDRVSVSAEGPGSEDLLVAWLEEVLFAFEGRGFAPAAARVERMVEGRLEGTLSGEAFDRRRHRVRSEVKAVTYHDLVIKGTPQGLEVRIIFDV